MKCDAALIAGRREAGNVSDYTPPDRHKGRGPVVIGSQHLVDDAGERVQCLVLLSIRENHLGDPAALPQCGSHPVQIEWRHDIVADKHHLRTGQVPGQQIAVLKQIAADVDRVTALPEVEVQCMHEKGHGGSSIGMNPGTHHTARRPGLSLLQLPHQTLSDSAWAAAVGIDNMVSDLAVERVTGYHQVPQYLLGITLIQQWATPVTSGAAHLLFDSGVQVDHESTPTEGTAVLAAGNHPPACCQYRIVPERHLLDHLLFPVAKALLTLNIKDPRDICAGRSLDFRVSISELQLQLLSQIFADG